MDGSTTSSQSLDGKANYLNDIPLVLKYTRAVAGRYNCFKPLLRILDQVAKQSS